MVFKKKPLNAEEVGKDKLLNVPNTFGGGSAGGSGAGVGATGKAQTSSQVQGAYNKDKGGYVADNGQLYPTTNPDFVPNANTEQIRFEGNKVLVSPKGSNETIELSRDEYKVSQGGAGNITNNVKQLEQARQPMPQTAMDIPSPEQLSQNVQGADIRNTTAGNILQGVAQAIDSITSTLPVPFLKSKEPKAVSDAKQGFSSMSSVIDDDIKLYQAGAKSLAEVDADISKALEFTVALQRQTKGHGQANLEFWRDKGAGIEAEVYKQLTELENKKRMLGLQ